MPKSKIIRLNSPRKQHIIPRTYLDHFSNSNGRIFVYEVGKPVRQSVPGKEAAERDFFEYKVGKEDTSFQFEKALDEIESLAGPIHCKLLKHLPLSYQERGTWAMYVATIFLRSRRVRDQLSVKLMEADIAAWMSVAHFRDMQCSIFREYGRLVPVSEIENAAKKTLEEYEIPAYRHIRAITGSAFKLANLLVERRWQLIESYPDSPFPTCDAPALSFQMIENRLYEGFGWGLPNVHIALPLSPKLMFIASPNDKAWVPKLDARSSDLMTLLVLKFADRNIFSHSHSSGLEKLFNEQERNLVFGENAYRGPSI